MKEMGGGGGGVCMNSSTHILTVTMQEKRVVLVSELKLKTKGFGVFLSVGGNSFHMSRKRGFHFPVTCVCS